MHSQAGVVQASLLVVPFRRPSSTPPGLVFEETPGTDGDGDAFMPAHPPPAVLPESRFLTGFNMETIQIIERFFEVSKDAADKARLYDEILEGYQFQNPQAML